MKIICTYDVRKFVNEYIDNINSEIPVSVNINNRKISHCLFSYDSILDIDENDYLLFKIRTGKNLPTLEKVEYYQLMQDGSVFLSKEKSKEIKLLTDDFLKSTINS